MVDIVKDKTKLLMAEFIAKRKAAEASQASDIANLEDVKSDAGESAASVLTDAICTSNKLGSALEKLKELDFLPA